MSEAIGFVLTGLTAGARVAAGAADVSGLIASDPVAVLATVSVAVSVAVFAAVITPFAADIFEAQ